MSYALGRPLLMNLEAFAQVTQVHPDLITHFVTLGLLDPVEDASGGMWFDQLQRARLARLQRLRSSFAINYAALGIVVDLLDRVAELEADQNRSRRSGGSSPWT